MRKVVASWWHEHNNIEMPQAIYALDASDKGEEITSCRKGNEGASRIECPPFGHRPLYKKVRIISVTACKRTFCRTLVPDCLSVPV